MKELLKLSMMSKFGKKESIADMKVKEKENVKELGASMAKESMMKVLVKI
ncbi:hypothetical protein [Sporosarcina sp. FSL K6-2383]